MNKNASETSRHSSPRLDLREYNLPGPTSVSSAVLRRSRALASVSTAPLSFERLRTLVPALPSAGAFLAVPSLRVARCWRRWYASEHYRASAQGKERRRAQSRRYRERRRQQAATPVASVLVTAPADVSSPCQPQPASSRRPAQVLGNFVWRACRRPGCYELFAVPARSPGQHFCSCLCRQALRRVLDREAHWRRRHRRRRRQLVRAPRPSADSS